MIKKAISVGVLIALFTTAVPVIHSFAEDVSASVPAELVEVPPAASDETIHEPVTTSALAGTALPFIQNQGQLGDSDILYYANTFAGSAGITQAGVRYALPYTSQQQDPDGIYVLNPDLPEGITYKDAAGNIKTNLNIPDAVLVVSETFVGGSGSVPAGRESMDVDVSSFVGNKPSNWHSGLPAFRQVQAGEVWSGVTVSYQATGTNIEKIFTIAPQANAAAIQMRVSGGTLSVNAQGELVIATAAGDMTLTKPVAFQDIDGARTDVAVSYHLLSDSTYAFTVGDYNPAYPLVIDPLLAGTYLGGTSIETAFGMGQNAAGDIYLVGYTWNGTFPVSSNAYGTSFAGGLSDQFIARFSADLTTLKSSTLIGGSGLDATTASVAFDADNNVYVASTVGSSNFPTTAGGFDQSYNGGSSDVAVVKMPADLSTLLASTFIGTTGTDTATTIAVAASGEVYASGYTSATGIPVTVGAYDETYNGGADVFIVRMPGNLSTVTAGTYLGGSGTDHNSGGNGMVLEADGSVVVVGGTASADFPTTVGAYDTTPNGSYDVFVSRLSSGLTTLAASTVVGGSGDDDHSTYESVSIAADGSLYVSSGSTSTNFPVTGGSYAAANAGSADFVAFRLSANLANLLYSTYLGGTGTDWHFSSALSPAGYLYLVGYTTNGTFPSSVGAYQTVYGGGGGDGVVAALSADMSSVFASTYIGGTGIERVYDLVVNPSGNIVVAAYLQSDLVFPTGGYDASRSATDAGALIFTPNLSLNDPPTVVMRSTVQSPGTNRVAASITVSDLEKAETSVAVEYSLDNTTWHNATVAEAYEEGGFVSVAGNVISSIDTTNTIGSKEVVFWWDAGVDTPNTANTAVYLRVTPSDQLTAGTAVTSSTFALDTRVAVGAVAVAPASGGGSAVVVPAPAQTLLPVSDPVEYPTIISSTPDVTHSDSGLLTIAPTTTLPTAQIGGVVLLARYQETSELIRILQQLLNAAHVSVATSGPGSFANETAYFGPKTLQALHRFQTQVLAGYTSPFGPQAFDTYLWNALVGR